MTTLYKHQQEAIDFAIERNAKCAFWHSCGTGKTLTSLSVFANLRESNPALRMLVFCPKSIIGPAWLSDIAKFTNLIAGILKETTNGDILITNYEYAIGKNGLTQLTALQGDWLCVLDESSRLKAFNSLTSKTLLKIKNKFKHRIVMSGTPCPNNELELFSQISFICDVLPKSYYQFRNIYAYLERNGQRMLTHGLVMNKYAMQEAFRKGFKYTISDNNRKKLLELIRPYCHYANKDECLDLPEKIDEYREIELSLAERKAYREMKNTLIAEIGNEVIAAPIALTKLQKLRQFTSGFAYNEKGDVVKIGDTKINELLQIIEELGKQQVVIFAQYKYEIEQIHKLLPNSVTMYSDTDDKNQSVAEFQSGKAQYFIGHQQSAAHGLTLTTASTMIFFSYDYSFEGYEQARNRIHRIGQQNKCTYIHIVAKNTIDEAILKVLQKKNDLQQLVQEVLK